MRALAIVLVAAFVIALSGAAPVSAQESSTPGLWINPKLGLRGPMASHGNDRSRASITRELCERFRKRDGLRVAYPGSYNSCLVYMHVMALRPYEGKLETETTFLATKHTVARLSPVLFENFSSSNFFAAIMADILGLSGTHFELWGPHFAQETFLEARPWRRGKQLARWAVWAAAPEERVAGLRFAPRIRFESHDERYSIHVWGVGLWPETGDLVLVVTYGFGYGRLHEHSPPFRWWGPGGLVAVLCHDPRLDMFRFMKLEDRGFDSDAERHLPRHITCRKKAVP
jgi:hypothetical protein